MFRTGLCSELLQHKLRSMAQKRQCQNTQCKVNSLKGWKKSFPESFRALRVRKDKEGSWERFRSYRHTHLHAYTCTLGYDEGASCQRVAVTVGEARGRSWAWWGSSACGGWVVKSALGIGRRLNRFRRGYIHFPGKQEIFTSL